MNSSAPEHPRYPVINMNNDPKFIRFTKVPQSPDRKTNTWVISSLADVPLGLVKWFGAWRQYAFHPEPNTVFERQCLRDIATFCDVQTTLHRESWKSRAA